MQNRPFPPIAEQARGFCKPKVIRSNRIVGTIHFNDLRIFQPPAFRGYRTFQ